MAYGKNRYSFPIILRGLPDLAISSEINFAAFARAAQAMKGDCNYLAFMKLIQPDLQELYERSPFPPRQDLPMIRYAQKDVMSPLFAGIDIGRASEVSLKDMEGSIKLDERVQQCADEKNKACFYVSIQKKN